jgi:glycosyltransferase involved in cell wall biosynthesis
MQHSVNSSALYRYILQVADSFDAIFFIPYLFGTTFWGSLLRPDKSYLIPCLHDESYAYTDVVASMFRQVCGAIFNAAPEQELANRLYGTIRGGAVGMGFVPPSEEEVAALTPYFEEHFPYIVYVGRKETGKNAHLLIDYFMESKDTATLPSNLKLVIAGGGSFSDLNRPAALERDDILDVGHLSEVDKKRVIKYAHALCQPSLNESFSIVLMEAWLLGTPIIVHADCEVTRYQATRSGGGLYFSSAKEFGGVASKICQDQDLREKMAAAGEKYVLTEYNWDSVIERFDNVMDSFLLPVESEKTESLE